MQHSLKKFLRLFSVLVLLSFCVEGLAQQGLSAPFIDSIPVKKDSFRVVRDELFYSTVLHSKLIKPYYEKNIVTLKFNESAGFMLSGPFSVSAVIRTDFVKYRSATDSVTGNRLDTLIINYNAADTAKYNSQYSVVFDSMQNVKITVTKVTITGTGSTADIVKSILVENQVQPSPNFLFSCTANALTAITIDTDPSKISTTGELTILWP